MSVLREDIYNFVNNPCWNEIKTNLILNKEEKYEKATTEDTRVATVKSCMDKISVIDGILDLENDFIEQYNNPKGDIK